MSQISSEDLAQLKRFYTELKAVASKIESQRVQNIYELVENIESNDFAGLYEKTGVAFRVELHLYSLICSIANRKSMEARLECLAKLNLFLEQVEIHSE